MFFQPVQIPYAVPKNNKKSTCTAILPQVNTNLTIRTFVSNIVLILKFSYFRAILITLTLKPRKRCNRDGS